MTLIAFFLLKFDGAPRTFAAKSPKSYISPLQLGVRGKNSQNTVFGTFMFQKIWRMTYIGSFLLP